MKIKCFLPLIIIFVVLLSGCIYLYPETSEKEGLEKPIITTTTTTIQTLKTCSNFIWEIIDVEEFELKGNYHYVMVNFSAQYTGNETIEYYIGSHDFKISDDAENFYNPQETYIHCPEEDIFTIGTVDPEDIRTGCLEFRIPDENEPTKLVFYDYIVHTLCNIDL